MNQLYKRLLLTLFPEEMRQADISPAHMFISSLSTKEFFSILCRRIVEYYKFNGFDTGLETFEAKIGIGVEQGIDINKTQDYYGYLIAAQYTGHTFYSPASVALHFALMSGTLLLPHANRSDESLMITTLQAIYFTPFVFAARIKRFPPLEDPKKTYKRFVSVWSEIFLWTQEAYYPTSNHDPHEALSLVHQEPRIFEYLLFICQRAGQLFSQTDEDHTLYWSRMLDDHIFDHSHDPLASFVALYDDQSFESAFHDVEKSVLAILLPRDFLLQNLYDHIDFFDTIEYVISPWYTDREDLSSLRQQLADDKSVWPQFLQELTSITTQKELFWSGVQRFITHKRSQQANDMEENIDEFISAINEGSPVDLQSVPESVKAESRSIEQIVNFYVGVVGSHQSAKGDGFWHRWICDERADDIASVPYRDALHDSMYAYRAAHMDLYHANGFYYQRAREQIKDGKQKFHIPLHTSYDVTIGINTHTIQQCVDHAIMHVHNVTLPIPMQLSVHQHDIVDLYKELFYDRIAPLLHDTDVLCAHHHDVIDQFAGSPYSTLYLKWIEHDIIASHHAMRQSLYMVDHWLVHDTLSLLTNNHGDTIQSIYDNSTLIVIISELQKTLFGVVLWIIYMKKHTTDHELHSSHLLYIYLTHVLHIDTLLVEYFSVVIRTIISSYESLLLERVELDDNPYFFATCHTMRTDIPSGHHLSHEDVIWLHSILHHITSYNRRYLIPQ